MKPHRTIANRPMSVAACDVAWPSSGLQELPVGWFAPESEGDFWFVFTGSSLPIALHECPILQNRTLLQPAMPRTRLPPEPHQQQSQPPHPTLPHQPYRQPSPCVPHPHSPTRPALPRPADAHTSPMTKSSNVTPNMSQSISSLSQTSRSTPPSCGCIAIRNQILRRNRQLRDAKLASRVFYDNRKTLEIPTIPRVLSGADDGSRTRL